MSFIDTGMIVISRQRLQQQQSSAEVGTVVNPTDRGRGTVGAAANICICYYAYIVVLHLHIILIDGQTVGLG